MTLKRSLTSSSINTGDRFHLFNPNTQYAYKAGTITGTTNGSGLIHVTFTTPLSSIPSIILNIVGTGSLSVTLAAANVTTTGFDIYANDLENGYATTGLSMTVNWIAVQPVSSSFGLSAGYTSAATTDTNGRFRVNFPTAYTSIPTVVTTHRDITSGMLNTDNLNHFVDSVDLNGFNVTVTQGEVGDYWRNKYVGQFSWIANPPASAADGISSGSVTTANTTITPSFINSPGFGTTYTSAPIVCTGWSSLPEPVGSEPGAEIYINTTSTTGFVANIQTYEGSLTTRSRIFSWVAAVARNS
jgi:hypothetical protein